jgi:hypothetical protein
MGSSSPPRDHPLSGRQRPLEQKTSGSQCASPLERGDHLHLEVVRSRIGALKEAPSPAYSPISAMSRSSRLATYNSKSAGQLITATKSAVLMSIIPLGVYKPDSDSHLLHWAPGGGLLDQCHTGGGDTRVLVRPLDSDTPCTLLCLMSPRKPSPEGSCHPYLQMPPPK